MQCVAIDANVARMIIRTCRYYTEGKRIKSLQYAFLLYMEPGKLERAASPAQANTFFPVMPLVL